jgi:hypothetical protein
MPIPQSKLTEILDQFQEEGNPVLHLAPQDRLSRSLPEKWGRVMRSAEPWREIIPNLWSLVEEDLPKTCAMLREKIIGVGLLSTRRAPFSLLYLFRHRDEIYAMRGFPSCTVKRPEASKLPSEFLRFYDIHDGWVDIYAESHGPSPSADWFFISDILDDEQAEELRDDFDPKKFLAVYHNGAASFVGFDLTQSPPLCFICWKDDPPEPVPDVWECLDDWIVEYLDYFDSRSS